MLTFGSKWNLNSRLTCEGPVFDRFIQTLKRDGENGGVIPAHKSKPITANKNRTGKPTIKKKTDPQPATFIEQEYASKRGQGINSQIAVQ